MKKTHYRDYATSAFLGYALGGSEKYKSRIWENALLENGCDKFDPTSTAILRAENAVISAMPEILDLKAVEKLIEIIERMDHGVKKKKVFEMVYLSDPGKELRKND